MSLRALTRTLPLSPGFPGLGALFALLFVGSFWVLPGCDMSMEAMAPGDNLAGGADAGAEGAECYENDVGQCVLASEGCDPADISGSVVERCAACDGGGVQVCGPARTARCFELELAGPCQRCVTDDGQVLYDDCAAPADELGDLLCESVSYDSDDARADETTCEVCRDANGQVVRESCRPNATECRDVIVNGRDCQECFTAEGELAYRECERADLDPRVCEVYGGAGGSCVDCYGDDDELLSHECTSGGSFDGGVGAPARDASYCDEVLDPAGRTCERCYSETGTLVSESCVDDVEAAPGRCQQLTFSEQSCLVCVDDSGQEASTQCESTTNACASPDACPVPSCENTYTADGTLCRTCPTSNAAADGSETRCMSDSDLVCVTDQSFSEAPPPEGGDDPALVSEVCTVCSAAGVEQYRACSSDGSVPPQPVCSAKSSADGAACEECVEAASGDVVYSSCDERGPAPPPEP